MNRFLGACVSATSLCSIDSSLRFGPKMLDDSLSDREAPGIQLALKPTAHEVVEEASGESQWP